MINTLERVIENDTFQYYVLKVVTNQEKSMKERILKEMFTNNLSDFLPEVIIPTEKILVMSKGKKIIKEKIVMPGYLIIKADLKHGEIIPVLKKIKGSYGFLSMKSGKIEKIPEPMRQNEVDRFTYVVDDTEKINLLLSKFDVNDSIKILNGPFVSFIGYINEVDENKKRLRVIVKIFGRDTHVEIDFVDAEKIIK